MEKHEVIKVEIDQKDQIKARNKSVAKGKLAKHTTEKMVRHIKKSEIIYHPSRLGQKLILGGCVIWFLLICLTIARPYNEISNEAAIVFLGHLFGLSIVSYISWKKLNKQAFSIRLNAFGMMVTHFSKKNWYSWGSIEDIKIRSKKRSNTVTFRIGTQINASFLDDLIGQGYTELPHVYSISSSNLSNLMRSYKYRYKNMGLNKYPELDAEAMKDPPIEKLWGRLGATRQKS